MRDEPSPTDLRSTSDELLEAVNRVRDLEREKRQQPISTPRFHELADDIADEARHVFHVADHEEHQGDDMHTQDATIDAPGGRSSADGLD